MIVPVTSLVLVLLSVLDGDTRTSRYDATKSVLGTMPMAGRADLESGTVARAVWRSGIAAVHPVSGLGGGLAVAVETRGPVIPLWDPSVAVPKRSELSDLPGTSFHVIKRHEPEKDGYEWLHGIALSQHKGRLYATFGHNRGAENTASEVAHSCFSDDHGASWSALQLIDDGAEENLAISHGVLLSHQGQLWAFQGAFYGRLRDVHTRAYVLDESSGRWMAKGTAMRDGFWPMDRPQRMANGNWIVSGIRVENGSGGANDPAAVAMSHGDDLSQWDLVVIPKTASNDMWGESTILVDGPNIQNIARYRRPIALVAYSADYGRTWSASRESNLPMTASKPFAGRLSNGFGYLICTTTADAGNRRSPLTIAIARPGESFSKVFRIRDALHGGPGESHGSAALAYPYAIEVDGKLYVAYSNDGGRGKNRNSAELAVIPLVSLVKID